MEQPHHGQGINSTAASPAKNSSLSSNLGIPMPNREAGECKHFVIRQYALDMREKDTNKCLPFASDGDIEKLLPPIVVPKFKYWYCQNCLNGNGAVNSLEDIVVFCKHCESEMISKTISSPSPPNIEMEIVLFEERIIDENACTDLSIDRDTNLSLATDKNVNYTKVVQLTEIGQQNVEAGESPEGCAILGGLGLNEATKVEESGNDSLPHSDKQRKRKALKGREKNRPSNKEIEVINLDPESDSERNVDGVSCLTKKRRIRVQVKESKAFAGPQINQFLGEGPYERCDVETTIKGSDTHAIRPLDLTLSNVGHGVLSTLSPEENRIFHENHKRKYNFYPGETSTSHKSTSALSVEQSLKNVIDKFDKYSRRNFEVSRLPSTKNLPVVQNLDFSMFRKDDNQIAFPKAKEKVIMPWLQKEFPTTRSNLAPTNGHCLNWPKTPRNDFNYGQMKNQSVSIFDAFPQRNQGKASECSELGSMRNRYRQGNEAGHALSPLVSDQMPFRGKNKNMGTESLKRTPMDAGMQSSQPFNVDAENLVEKELFPCKFNLKSRTGESSSSFNSTHVPVKHFGKTLDGEKAKGPHVPAVSTHGIDSRALKRRTISEVCTMNLNPADFSYPNARNPFMINGAELKVKTRAHSRGKTVKANGNGGKKQAQHRPT